MMKHNRLVTLLVGLLTSLNLHAAQTPAMFSSVKHFNTPEAEIVTGIRLAVLHGQVEQVKGIDLALLGMSETNKSTGINVGILGGVKVKTEMKGASISLFNWMQGQTLGANVSIVNITNDVKGMNLGVVNYSEGDTSFDWAIFSISKSSRVQLGLINMTDTISGVQIGIFNCAENGFFKCFPLINFAK